MNRVGVCILVLSLSTSCELFQAGFSEQRTPVPEARAAALRTKFGVNLEAMALDLQPDYRGQVLRVEDMDGSLIAVLTPPIGPIAGEVGKGAEKGVESGSIIGVILAVLSGLVAGGGTALWRTKLPKVKAKAGSVPS